MKFGKDVVKFKKRGQKQLRRPPIIRSNYNYKRLLSEIKKIETTEQLDIVKEMIQNAYLDGKISDEQRNTLYSRLNERASKVGEKRIAVKVGPLEFKGEKKGEII